MMAAHSFLSLSDESLLWSQAAMLASINADVMEKETQH